MNIHHYAVLVMKVEISLALSCLIFLITTWCLTRQILRKIFAGYWAFYTWSFFLGAFGFAALDLFGRLGGAFAYSSKIQTGLLGLFEFAFLAIYFFYPDGGASKK